MRLGIIDKTKRSGVNSVANVHHARMKLSALSGYSVHESYRMVRHMLVRNSKTHTTLIHELDLFLKTKCNEINRSIHVLAPERLLKVTFELIFHDNKLFYCHQLMIIRSVSDVQQVIYHSTMINDGVCRGVIG